MPSMPETVSPPAMPPAMTPAMPAPQQPRSRHFRTFRVIMALILRETGSRESRTSLGFLWTFIDPLITVVILSIIFSFIQRTPPLGTSFELYYVTGVIPFHLYSHIAGRVAGSVRFSSNLLTFPSVTIVDVLVSRFLLNAFTNTLVFLIAAYGTIAFFDLSERPDIYGVMSSLGMAAALGLGVGTMNSVLFLWSSAYASLWGYMSRPLMVLSGVMIPIHEMPTEIYDVLKWIPMTHFITEMRASFFPSLDDRFVSPSYVLVIAVVTFVIGLLGLHRYVFDFLERR